MIRNHAPHLVNFQGTEPIVSRQHAIMPCGCVCHVGIAVPDGCHSLIAVACSESHTEAMLRVTRTVMAVAALLPVSASAVQLCDDLMLEALSRYARPHWL